MGFGEEYFGIIPGTVFRKSKFEGEIIMTRGNQRELARAKNAKKLQEQAKQKGVDVKGANAGLTLEQRKQRDADRMREKQLQKQGDAEAAPSEKK